MQIRKNYPGLIQNVWISDGKMFARRYGKTASEPVKTVEFAHLLFPLVAIIYKFFKMILRLIGFLHLGFFL
jgi:hypothetical protein